MPSFEHLSRRNFLGIGVVAAGALLPSRVAEAAAAAAVSTAPDRTLSFLHTHTNERLTTSYCCDGEYVSKELVGINHLLRDFRVNEIKPIDPRLLDLLYELNTRLGTDQPFHVISGYRSPQTNAMLHERGGSHSGVATHSLHMEGKAIDIRVPGIKLAHLRDTAKTLRVGGVGYYPASDFVHIDTGRVRYW